ncbi:marvel domain-containing protein [Aspergillus filifer]
MHPVQISLRIIQLATSAIVLGTSISLALAQNTSLAPVPAPTGYAAFCGGLGILVTLVGGLVEFLSDSGSGLRRERGRQRGRVMSWVDCLAGIVLVVGGVSYAVLLKNTPCTADAAQYNALFNGGCKMLDRLDCAYVDKDPFRGTLERRCTTAKADCAFMFLAVVAFEAGFCWEVVRR